MIISNIFLASSKGNKSIDSTRSDDSLTSLEWLSTMGNPTTPVLSVVPEPPKYNVYDLVSLAFRLARKAVSYYKIFNNFFENFR